MEKSMSVTENEARQPHCHPRTFTIVVNGEDKQVVERRVTFWEVVELAFGPQTPNPNICYTMTFKKAAGKRKKGHLVEGDSVKVKDGTVFNVTRTDKS